MKKRRRSVFKNAIRAGLCALIVCIPSITLGWADGGHMMIAFIAYDKRLNPKAKAKVDELLKIPINPVEVSKKSKDFINASHWADDIRVFSEFDEFKSLHFIDIPFSDDGHDLSEVHSPNIVTALDAQVNVLRTSTDKKAQAQALRLIIHFVGDIHQPLHCSTRIDNRYPEGDLGGNLFSIQVPDKTGKLRKSNLHSYWDNGIDSFPKTGPNFSPPLLRQIPPAAAKATAGNPDTDPELRLNDPFNFETWAEESYELAKNVAYKGVINDKKPTASYNRKALKVVNKRIAWAGYRLAALLNSIWPNN